MYLPVFFILLTKYQLRVTSSVFVTLHEVRYQKSTTGIPWRSRTPRKVWHWACQSSPWDEDGKLQVLVYTFNGTHIPLKRNTALWAWLLNGSTSLSKLFHKELYTTYLYRYLFDAFHNASVAILILSFISMIFSCNFEACPHLWTCGGGARSIGRYRYLFAYPNKSHRKLLPIRDHIHIQLTSRHRRQNLKRPNWNRIIGKPDSNQGVIWLRPKRVNLLLFHLV